MKRQAVISSTVAPVYVEPVFSSEMVTQALIWENVQVLEIDGNWYQIRMEDMYDGWIHSFYLHHRDPAVDQYTFITKRAVPIFQEMDKMDTIIALLPFGAYVPRTDNTDDFSKIYLPDGKTAYMESQEQVVQKCRETIIKLAISLLGVPYLWGGRSSFGYDCSGFVQMVLKTAGIDIPRDTHRQVQTKKLEKIHIDNTEPGDLVFFAESSRINHVGFMIGEGKIIHCSGQVKIESIIEAEIGFSKHLSQYEIIAMSISRIVSS